eukprot:TRINITY_DN9167_c1_g1_i1.p1 TRINITY_DN9167_c1_g1~~TRINITY_DN9167_c1_g1_i1.p1  ORF type:complete len:318 (+),score=55.33 TRINITY_DN9167_c1_g1_i1:34-987(+)
MPTRNFFGVFLALGCGYALYIKVGSDVFGKENERNIGGRKSMVTPPKPTPSPTVLPCGETASVNFDWGGIPRKVLYLAPCVDNVAEPMPIISAVHCYGCTPDMEIQRYKDAALKRKMVIVSGEGIGASFNGGACCGQAMKEGLDDVGFTVHGVEVVKGLLKNKTGKVFGTGFSNGGFLATKIANERPGFYSAVAVMSGYDYSVLTSTSPTPMLLHHSLKDDLVIPTGCCSTSKCIAGISEASTECVATTDFIDRWASVNKCGDGRTETSHDGFSCVGRENCGKKTILCHHDHPGHRDWARPHPVVTEHILNFFETAA